MNHDEAAPQKPLADDPFDESEVARVFDAYLADLEAGRPVDPKRLLAEHPEIADQLRACLEVMDLANQVANGSSTVPPDPGLALDGSTFSAARSAGLMTTLDLDLGTAGMPQVLLREPADEPEPLMRPRSTEMPELGAGSVRYQLQGEIARGGMGAILKGRDIDLGRDLAIKVLLESHKGNPQITRRFVEEAQIGGQLQHPGIVPVYDLGTFPDRRPFFAMKLVKGQTLASMLADRRAGSTGREGRRAAIDDRDPVANDEPGSESVPAGTIGPTESDRDLPRFLTIFEAVCQTMAYAHARRVIHRDLKPANVMVGRFGEVQVMDWGLAKVLPEGGVADEERARALEQESLIETVRSGPTGSGSESQAGSVVGTPSYMAPEQARGEVDRIDERSDVFGLGAILCEILTGKPPFVGSSRGETREKAARGDLIDALARLDARGADPELVALAKHCLAPERDRRPRDAGEVAERMAAYLAGVQNRLRTAELARVEAQTRAAEERKRRGVTVALAASVLVTAGLLGGGWAFLARQHAARLLATTRVVTDALAEAERLRGHAQQAAPGDLSKWSEALGAARRAQRLLDQGEADDGLRKRVTVALSELDREQAAAQQHVAELERDRRFLDRLEAIRGTLADHWNWRRTDAEYADAFRSFGMDLQTLDPKIAAESIRDRSAPIEIASFLDDWSRVRRRARGEGDLSWRRLVSIAKAVDQDPWRNTVRDHLTGPRPQLITQLAGDDGKLRGLPATSLILLAEGLLEQGQRDRARAVLSRARRAKPDDFWVNLILSKAEYNGETFDNPENAVRFMTAAESIRPRSSFTRSNLGATLTEQGKLDEAIAELNQSVRLNPENAEAHVNLGNALSHQGKPVDAIAEYREAARLKPGLPEAHNNLGKVMLDQGRLGEAIGELNEALRLRPNYSGAHVNLGNAFTRQKKLSEAISQYREAIRLRPENANAHNNLGLALRDQGALANAIVECREAIRLKPGDSDHHNSLGTVLATQGKLPEAVAQFREAIQLRPENAMAHSNLGRALRVQGDLASAMAECRTAIRLKADDAYAHCNLGAMLGEQAKLDEAIVELRTALRLKPDMAEARHNLGKALAIQGGFDMALEELGTAIRLNPDIPDAHYTLADVLHKQGRIAEAIAELRTAIRLKPTFSEAHNNLGAALASQGNLDEAVSEFRTSISLKPEQANAHRSLGVALAKQRKYSEAVSSYEAAIRIKPDAPATYYDLGIALREQGLLDASIDAFRTFNRLKPEDPDAHYNLGVVLGKRGASVEAIAEYRTTIRLKPDYAEAYCNLGQHLRKQGVYDEAAKMLRKGHELGTGRPGWPYPSAAWVAEAERMLEISKRLRAILQGRDKPRNDRERLTFAQMAHGQQLFAAASRLWTEAMESDPKLVDDREVQPRYNAACAAALAAAGQGKDEPPLDEAAKVRWRKQAIEWLKADLAAWAKIVEQGSPQEKQAVAPMLQHWKADPDLASLREADAVAKLNAEDQRACRAVWSEVGALLEKAQRVISP
jgi:serine/threonine-protein kinase